MRRKGGIPAHLHGRSAGPVKNDQLDIPKAPTVQYPFLGLLQILLSVVALT